MCFLIHIYCLLHWETFWICSKEFVIQELKKNIYILRRINYLFFESLCIILDILEFVHFSFHFLCVLIKTRINVYSKDTRAACVSIQTYPPLPTVITIHVAKWRCGLHATKPDTSQMRISPPLVPELRWGTAEGSQGKPDVFQTCFMHWEILWALKVV